VVQLLVNVTDISVLYIYDTIHHASGNLHVHYNQKIINMEALIAKQSITAYSS